MARSIARRRSSSTTCSRLPMPATISSAIACGSSLRGLSFVTYRRSARRAATAPISERLPLSRSPPQPKTTASRAARRLAQRLAARSRARRACARNRRRRRSRRRAGAPCGPARARAPRDRARRSASSTPRCRADADRRQRVPNVEPPRQAQLVTSAVDGEAASVRRDGDRRSATSVAMLVDAVRDDLASLARELGRPLRAERIVGVENAYRREVKEPPLRRGVRLRASDESRDDRASRW